MTTVVVGGAGLAAAAAVAGAIGLGALAVAALSGGSRRRSRQRKKVYRRYGRDVAGVQEQAEVDLEGVLQDVLSHDETGCGRKLMCELAKEEESKLFLEELSILNLLGPDVRPGEGLLPPEGATGEFLRARDLGRNGGDCKAAFPACQYDGHQIMDSAMAYLQ